MALVHGMNREGEEVKSTNPVLIGGKNSGNKAQTLSVNNDGALKVNSVIEGIPVVAAGKKTDADSTDRTITTNGFTRISVINDGPAELRLAVDESTLNGSKIIYVSDAEGFDLDIAGETLHYSTTNDACSFRYVLR